MSSYQSQFLQFAKVSIIMSTTSWSMSCLKIIADDEILLLPALGRDNFFTHILKYLLPAPWIHYLEHLEDFYGIRFFFVKVKVSRISLQRLHMIYKRRCKILHNINSRDSSVGRAIGSDPNKKFWFHRNLPNVLNNKSRGLAKGISI